MNVISALMEIQKKPVTTEGEEGRAGGVGGGLPRRGVRRVHDARERQGPPVVHRARRLRSPPNGETITLEPMTKFPLVRDLVVDRSRMFEDLKRVQGVDPARRLARARPRPAPVAGEPGRGVSALALHDVRLLPRGVPADQRLVELHRPRRDQPGAPLQPAPERQDARAPSGSRR